MQSLVLAIEMAELIKHFGRHRSNNRLNLAVHSGSVSSFLSHRWSCPGRLYGIARAMQGAFHEGFSVGCLRRPGICDT
jgi:hypothetical protein